MIQQLELPATLVRMRTAAEAAGWTCEVKHGTGPKGHSVSLRMARGTGRCYGLWWAPAGTDEKLRWMFGEFGGVKCGVRGLTAHLFDAQDERRREGTDGTE